MINSICLVSIHQMQRALLGSPWQAGENKVRLLSYTKDRKTKYHPMFLGTTQVLGEITKSDDYKGTGQVRAVKEAGYARTVVFWRSTPLSKEAATTQLQKNSCYPGGWTSVACSFKSY